MDLIIIIYDGPGYAFAVNIGAIGTVEVLDDVQPILLDNFRMLFRHAEVVNMDIAIGISSDGYFIFIGFESFDF